MASTSADKITAVKGIGPSTAKILAERGILTVQDLASAKLSDLTAIPGFSGIRAAQVKSDAKSLLEDGPSSGIPKARADSKMNGGSEPGGKEKKSKRAGEGKGEKKKAKKIADKEEKQKSKKKGKKKSKTKDKEKAKSSRKGKKKK